VLLWLRSIPKNWLILVVETQSQISTIQ